ncbi:hypothetical protein L810_5198 [Burkholderia sp. AU4i]|nr:hypothetical protein L810_5198 [Burkholderia sp. AU4i]
MVAAWKMDIVKICLPHFNILRDAHPRRDCSACPMSVTMAISIAET